MKSSEKDITIANLSKHIKLLVIEKRGLEKRIKNIDEQIKSLNNVVGIVRRGGGQAEHKSDAYNELVKRINNDYKQKKITQINALVTIAKFLGDNNGNFKAQDAKRVMMDADLFANPTNADSIIYTLIDRSGKFKRINPGIYKYTNSDKKKNETIPFSTDWVKEQ